jgi:hypothetical protein
LAFEYNPNPQMATSACNRISGHTSSVSPPRASPPGASGSASAMLSRKSALHLAAQPSSTRLSEATFPRLPSRASSTRMAVTKAPEEPRP